MLARRRHTALSRTLNAGGCGREATSGAIHAAADANALADQLAALLTTQRAHIKAPGSGPPPPAGAMGWRWRVTSKAPPSTQEYWSSSSVAAWSCAHSKLRCSLSSLGTPRWPFRLPPNVDGRGQDDRHLSAACIAPREWPPARHAGRAGAPPSLSLCRSCASVFRIGPLQKPVCTFSFDRRTEVSEILLLAAKNAIEERRDGLNSRVRQSVHAEADRATPSPRHRTVPAHARRLRQDRAQAIRLTMQPAGVSETALNKPAFLAQADRAVQLLHIWRGAVAVIDEVDVVLHPLKSELNWPLGDRYPLDFAPIRWEMPWYLFEGILTAAFLAASRWRRRNGNGSPPRSGAGGGSAHGGGEWSPKEKAVLNSNERHECPIWLHEQPATAHPAPCPPIGLLLPQAAASYPRRLAAAVAAKAGPARRDGRAGACGASRAGRTTLNVQAAALRPPREAAQPRLRLAHVPAAACFAQGEPRPLRPAQRRRR